MKNKIGMILTVVLFGLAAVGFFVFAQHPLIKQGGGDEPHYLITADSLANFGGAELSAAYRTGHLARTLLPAEDLDFTAEEVAAARGNWYHFHSVAGENGVFSVHNLGLPILMMPIVKLGGGMVAAKWLLILLSLSLPLLAWRAAEAFIAPGGQRLVAGISLSAVTFFAIAASQLYPDFLAGVLLGNVALSVVARRLGEDRMKSPWREAALVAAVAFVPWLHVRLIVPVMLSLAARFLLLRQTRGEKLAWIAAPALSLLALALYNHHAFGSYAGPYNAGSSVEFSTTALMVLFGLQFDQFQGIFVHAPLLLCAFVGLGALLRRDWRLALFLVLVYGSLVGPNAVHPNWYGGGSFGGRFVLAGGIVLLVPAAYGLARLFSARAWLGFAACGLHLLIESFLWYRYAIQQTYIFTQGPERMLDYYPSAWAPHTFWFPAFYRLDIAVRHWPNLAWIVAALLFIAAGWLWRRQDEARTGRFGWGERILVLACLVIVAGGAAGSVELEGWRVLKRSDIAALKLDPEPVRIRYGDPSEWSSVMSMLSDFDLQKLDACVEQPLIGASIPPNRICPDAVPTGPHARLALIHGDHWQLLRLQANPFAPFLDINFSQPFDGHILAKGWSAPETWGVWSVGPRSELRIGRGGATGSMRLDVDLMAFLPKEKTAATVSVSVNGRHMATWTFDSAKINRQIRSVWIPADIAEQGPDLTVSFEPKGVPAPGSVPGVSESRPLGVGLYGFTLRFD